MRFFIFLIGQPEGYVLISLGMTVYYKLLFLMRHQSFLMVYVLGSLTSA